jgi:hypothetical protein
MSEERLYAVLRLLLVITASVALALVVSSALAPAFGYQAKGRVALGNPRGAQPPITFEATCPLCKTTATQVRGHYDQPDREEYELLDKKLAVSKELWTVACPTKGCGILFAVEANDRAAGAAPGRRGRARRRMRPRGGVRWQTSHRSI